MNTLDQTVQATSGSAAAVDQVTPSGTGITCPAGHGDLLGVAAAGQQRADLVADRASRRPVADARRRCRCTPGRDVGGAGRRRVVALRCSRSARLTAVAATSMRTSPGPASGSGTSATPGPRGHRARRTMIAFIGSSLELVAGVVHELSSGTSSSMSTGSGAPRGPSQFSARTWAFAASRWTPRGRRRRQAGGVPEEVRVIGAACADDVVGDHFGQVEDQRLVDLGLDVEGVTLARRSSRGGSQGTISRKRGRCSSPIPSWRGTDVRASEPGEVRPGVDVLRLVARRGHLDGAPALHQPSHRYAVRVTGRRHPRSPYDSRRTATTRPSAASAPG